MNHPPRNIDLTCFNWVKLILKTNLPYTSKYMALYLSTYMNLNQDMAFPSLKRIEGETSLSHGAVLKHLKLLESEGWIIKQPGDRVTSNRYWINIPKSVIDRVGHEVTYVTSCTEVGHEVTSNNNRITNNTYKGRFKPPTVQEVEEYTSSRPIKIDSERFVDFYTSKGWLVGKSPMKDWKAAVRNWEKSHEVNKRKPSDQNERGISGAERTRRAREAARLRELIQR